MMLKSVSIGISEAAQEAVAVAVVLLDDDDDALFPVDSADVAALFNDEAPVD